MVSRPLAALACAALLVLAPVLAPGAASAATPATALAGKLSAATPPAGVLAARGFGGRGGFGRSGGFRSRRGGYRSPYRTPYRTRRRYGVGHAFGNVLKVLGVAYLFHAFFGWGGGGGSPFGLLIVLGLVLWFASRRRRLRAYRDPYGRF